MGPSRNSATVHGSRLDATLAVATLDHDDTGWRQRRCWTMTIYDFWLLGSNFVCYRVDFVATNWEMVVAQTLTDWGIVVVVLTGGGGPRRGTPCGGGIPSRVVEVLQRWC